MRLTYDIHGFVLLGVLIALVSTRIILLRLTAAFWGSYRFVS